MLASANSRAATRPPFTHSAAPPPPRPRLGVRGSRDGASARAHAGRSDPADAAAGGVPSTNSSSDSSAATTRRRLLAALPLGALVSALPAAADDNEGSSSTTTSTSTSSSTSSGGVPQGFKELYDPILAYRFAYPVQTTSGGELQMTLSHPPEKYSSAAPLTADARQRIVSELFDLRRFVTVSMTVGPASGVLKEVPQEEWKARDVALTVLIDRSTARLSSGQRTALNDVEEVHKEERDGQAYFVYEHTSQGSPTISNPRPETFRHALAVTTTRAGLDGQPYLYTLNLSCPQPLWDDLAGPFQQAVNSFALVATTGAYVPPDKDPWLFF